jgi:hypothetical protein
MVLLKNLVWTNWLMMKKLWNGKTKWSVLKKNLVLVPPLYIVFLVNSIVILVQKVSLNKNHNS